MSVSACISKWVDIGDLWLSFRSIGSLQLDVQWLPQMSQSDIRDSSLQQWEGRYVTGEVSSGCKSSKFSKLVGPKMLILAMFSVHDLPLPIYRVLCFLWVCKLGSPNMLNLNATNICVAVGLTCARIRQCYRVDPKRDSYTSVLTWILFCIYANWAMLIGWS